MKKRILSLLTTLAIVVGLTVCLPTVAASAETSDVLDIEVYKAQCISGIAYDEYTFVSECNKIYNYYISEDVYSPTQDYLDLCYSDTTLMLNYAEWTAYSLAADPSSALDMTMKKEDYYQTLIFSMYSQATMQDNAFQNLLENKVVNQSQDLMSEFCDMMKITDVASAIDQTNINNSATIGVLEDCVETFYPLKTAEKINSVLGDVLKYSSDIMDVVERISLYGEMLQLDDATKLWIDQMYTEAVSSGADADLISALETFKLASTNYGGVALASIKDTTFTLTSWVAEEAIEQGITALTTANPVLASVFAGLKAGKTICNIFFNTDDVCEQLYVMTCIQEIEQLSRDVTESCKNKFVNSQTTENAKAFNYAVDCYFELIINLDVDCMEEFLTKLYTGGLIKGSASEYEESIEIYDSLKEVRESNYNVMLNYYKGALKYNYPEVYALYYQNSMASDYEYEILDDGTAEITGYNGDATTLTIPSKLDGYVVTSIGRGAFYYCDNVTSAVVPDSVTNIGDHAFDNCDGLTSITLGHSVASIGDNAFTCCSRLRSITLPSSVTSIGDGAFMSCANLISATIPDSVVSLGDYIFCQSTSLSSVSLPNSIVSIGEYVFCNCFSLTSITIPNSVTSIGRSAFSGCDNLTIKCYKNSTALTYAKDNDISYYILDMTVPTVSAKSTYTSTSSAVRINWNKVSGATGYRIYRYNSTTKKWVKVTTIKNGSTTTYKQTGLKSGTTYKYKVKAYIKAGGVNYWGNASSTITTSTKPTTATFTTASKTKTAIRLNWKKVTGASGYQIQKYNSSTKKWSTVKTITSGSTLTYRISGLKKGTVYKYRIRAYRTVNSNKLYGAWSATKKVTTKS